MRRIALVSGVAFGIAGCALFADLGDLQGGGGDASPANIDGNEITDSGNSEASSCGDTTSSSQNCGTCGRVCGAGYACVDSHCQDEPVDVVTNASGRTMCAALRDGTVWCWGGALYQTLGTGIDASAPWSSTPVKIVGMSGAIRLAAGADHACALANNQNVYCWGANFASELGNPDAGPSSVPTPVQALIPPATDIVSGASKSCAVTVDGGVYCWGVTGSIAGVSAQEMDLAGATAFGVSMDRNHTCAIAGDTSTMARVWCWGVDNQGSTDGINDTAPEGTAFYTSLVNASVHVGNPDTCVIDNSVVHCWGPNNLGQLGIGSADNDGHFGTSTPLAVPAAKDLTIGENAALMIGPSNEVYGWGSAYALPLEDAGVTTCEAGPCVLQPTLIPALNGAAKVALSHSNLSDAWINGIALMLDGGVLVWGNNDEGQLAHDPQTNGDLNGCPSGASVCNPGVFRVDLP